MPRLLLGTSNPSDPLTIFKAGLAIAYTIVTLFSGMSVYKMLKSRGQKLISNASHFAAGVIFGTAIMDFMILSNHFFNKVKFRYPMALLVLFVGYAVAMLVDCLLAFAVRRLPQESFKNPYPKSLGDKIMISFVSDLKPTKYCGTAVETMDCGVVDYLRNLILFRAQLFLDCIFLIFSFSFLSLDGSGQIGLANTKTMAWRAFLNGMFRSIIYATSLVSTLLRSDQIMPLIVYLLFFYGSVTGLAGIIFGWIFLNHESMLHSGPSGPGGVDDGDAQDLGIGIHMGLIAGILVYLSVHHLLRDGNEPLTDTRFGKLVAVIFGVGAVSLMKFMEM